jgi:alanyl aminopeptidase
VAGEARVRRHAWILAALVGCARAVSPTPPPPRTAPPDRHPPAREVDLGEEPAGPLPDHATPLRYSLSLTINPARDRFEGEVHIQVRLDAAASGVWLHGRDLDVTSAEVRGSEILPARWVPGRRPGINSLRWSQPLRPGEVSLRIRYTAPFNRHLEGLYRVDTGGDSYAFTQFEALSARRAFPGFDDPRFKTPFDITLVVPRGQVAVTNTPEVSAEDRPDDLRAVRFAPTEPLPTYLLAFAVGPLDVVTHEPIAPNEIRTTPVPLRGVAARGRGGLLGRALDDAGPLVAVFERYFARAYPYPKLDLIAVPDFAAGAMENAGAITFREPLLLLRPDAPVDQVRAMDHVLAHELAHHWFGDLVTLRWWDDIWLNESFATWAAAWSTDAVFPDHERVIAQTLGTHGALGADALASAVPVRRPIATDDDLRGGSSVTIYQKGAAVLSMLERWLGYETFRGGIRAYLQAHVHGTAVSEDLFAALRAAAPTQPVERVVRDFVDQPGAPVLAMERVCRGARSHVRVSQRRFGLPAGSDTRAGAWSVPVCVRFLGADRLMEQACALIDAEHNEVPLPGRCPPWIAPNAQGEGYYRSALQRPDWEALVRDGWAHLSERERLSLVGDAQALLAAGVLRVAQVRALLARAATDPGNHVGIAAIDLWRRIFDVHGTPATLPAMRAEAARPYLAVTRSLGWRRNPGEAPGITSLRPRLASFLGLDAHDPGVLREGARLGAAYLSGGALSPELIAPCVGMHLRSADEAAARAAVDRAVGSDDALVRGALLAALGEAPLPVLQSVVLPLTLDPRVRVNEVMIPLRAALARAEVRGDVFAWFTAHADEVLGRVGEGGRTGAPWLAARFCTAEDRARAEAFFAPRAAAIAGSEGQLRGALEAIDVCVAERAAQRETVAP